jgi:hypothetical protein
MTLAELETANLDSILAATGTPRRGFSSSI